MEIADDDPFAEEEVPIRVQEVGLPIDLTGESAELSQRLAVNLKAQSDLYNQGVDCPLRWEDEVACSACPVAQADGPHGRLCSLAKEQESITSLMAARRHGL